MTKQKKIKVVQDNKGNYWQVFGTLKNLDIISWEANNNGAILQCIDPINGTLTTAISQHSNFKGSQNMTAVTFK